MRIFLLILGILVGGAMAVSGQTHTLKGTISDSTGSTLPGTTVVLMNRADSSLYKFALTDKEGQFSIVQVANGNYLLQLSYLGFQNYMLPIDIKESDAQIVDLKQINLQEKNVSLGGVVISADIIPMVFKKDTVEYNANAFKTQPDARVEDLLKRMPGVEVDGEGNITAHGEKVQKVLVDGKEFFGDDPKMATKNLPAKAVDKVQVYDKQSDMSEFTGVDDGERMRTINLKLKEDYKEGIFGNAEAGVGGNETLDPLRYKGRFSINRFQKKTQISTIGMLNNVNEQGFSTQDYVDFMGGMGNVMRTMGGEMGGGGGGGNNLGVPLSTNLNNGNVTSGAGGLNFNWTPSKKTKLASSYFYSGLGNDVHRDLIKTTFLEDVALKTTETNDQYSGSGSHRLNLRLDQNLDSLQTLTFKATGLYQTGKNETEDIRANAVGDLFANNSTLAFFNSEGDSWNADGELQYKRKFTRKGRSFTAEGKFSLGQSANAGFLDSRNEFRDPFTGALVRIDTTLQDQQNEGANLKYSGKISYTEPLGKGYFIDGTLSHASQTNESNKSFYDLETVGLPGELNTQLSNVFENTYTTEKAGLAIQKNGAKSNLTVGLDGEYSKLQGNLISSDTTLEKVFINALPRIRFRYQFNNSRRLMFNYSTNVSEPSVQQLSPIVDNSNPTRISVGNPDLRAQYVHNGRLSYFSFSPFSFTSIFATLNGAFTQNKITNATFVDSGFVQTIQPVNVARDLNLTASLGFNTPIKALGIKVGASSRTTFNRGLVYINSDLSSFSRWVQSGDFNVENRKKDKLDLRIGVRLSYNLTEYDVAPTMAQSFFNQEFYGDFTWNITPKWVVGSSMNYYIYSGVAFAQQSVPVWKASLSRFFLPGNKLQVKLYAFDILNLNSGVNRTSDLNYVQEETFRTVGRYVMLSAAYNILGFKKESTEGMPMRRMMQ